MTTARTNWRTELSQPCGIDAALFHLLTPNVLRSCNVFACLPLILLSFTAPSSIPGKSPRRPNDGTRSGFSQAATSKNEKKNKKSCGSKNAIVAAYQSKDGGSGGGGGGGGGSGGDSHGCPSQNHRRRRAPHTWVALRHRLNESLVASADSGLAGLRGLPNMDALVVSMRAKVCMTRERDQKEATVVSGTWCFPAKYLLLLLRRNQPGIVGVLESPCQSAFNRQPRVTRVSKCPPPPYDQAPEPNSPLIPFLSPLSLMQTSNRSSH